MRINKNLRQSQRQNWMAVSKYWCELEVETNKHEDLNLVLNVTKRRMKYTPL
jgi:hypothetical protein